MGNYKLFHSIRMYEEYYSNNYYFKIEERIRTINKKIAKVKNSSGMDLVEALKLLFEEIEKLYKITEKNEVFVGDFRWKLHTAKLLKRKDLDFYKG